MVKFFASILRLFFKFLDWLKPWFDLLARLWVSWIFFKAGLVKVQAWQSTLHLFNYEYSVPLLSPKVAAVLGTGAELILPILLFIGLGGRIMVFLFFIYNIVAVISYPVLWTPDGWNGLSHHISWGLLLAMLMTHGPGKFSIDYWIRKHHGDHLQ